MLSVPSITRVPSKTEHTATLSLRIENLLIQLFNKSLKLATADKTIHARNFMVYLTHKGVDLSVANQETIDHFAKLYRQE